VLFSCCACVLSCVVLGAIGSNISPHTCQPQFPHAKPMPTCTLAHMLHIMQDSCQPWARLVLARMLHPMQNPCQPWTWHECCNTSKTRANFGHARVVPIVIHRLSTGYPQVIHRLPHARLVPTLRPSKTRANFGHAKVVPMLGRGRGLTCVDNCSSHSGTKKVKTRKKEP